MKTVGSSTLRGGQTVFHGLRMWGQLLRAGVFLSAFAVVAVPAWHVWRNTTGYEWYAAGIVTVAELKLGLGYREDAMQEVRMADGSTRVLTVRELAASPRARAVRERLRDEVFASALLGARASLAVIAAFLLIFWYRGYQLNRARRIRGAELVSARELRRRVRPARLLPGRPTPYRVAGVPYPERAETKHTIVSGTTGSGKTVLISDLVDQIRSRGERCVIYDKMGTYTRAFFDPARDVLMNPLDARAPRWSPFLEARSPRDFDMMAAALIPQQKDTVDPFWVTAARQLFSNGAGVLWSKGVTENKVLVDHLLKTELTALAEAMEGTVAQSIVDPGEPEDRALGPRHADRKPLRARVPARHRRALLDPRLDLGRGRLPVPHLARRPARLLARTHIHLARDRGQRHALARPERRAAHLGGARRAPDAAPGALAPARPRRIAPVRRLLRARRPGDLRTPRPLRAQWRGDHLRALFDARGARRARPRHRAVVGRQPRAGARSRRSPRASPTAPTPSATAYRSRPGASSARSPSPRRSCSSRACTAISASRAPSRSPPLRSTT